MPVYRDPRILFSLVLKLNGNFLSFELYASWNSRLDKCIKIIEIIENSFIIFYPVFIENYLD